MKPVLAITMGDPSGIGPEIAVKALAHPSVTEAAISVLVGDVCCVQKAMQITGGQMPLKVLKSASEAQDLPGTLQMLDLGLMDDTLHQWGQVSREAGEAAFQYVVEGIRLAMSGAVEAVITGPINKEAIHLAGHLYAGHTEIFAEYTKTPDFAMMLASGNLRVIHVNTHVSMREAADRITRDRVLKVIRLADQALREMGIHQGRIAVAGFNCHASENGLFGSEEQDAIIPAIEAAEQKGLIVEGPVPPDTVFVKALAGQYDIVVAMYHDQGHIPLKLHGFKIDPATGRFASVSGINTTIGLPIVRTSVDHGTAFDVAGKGIANEESMVDAILMGARMALARRSKS